MAWDDLTSEIAEEFAAFAAEQIPLPTQRAVNAVIRDEIRYGLWSAREVERLSPELRAQLEHLTRSAAARAWQKQRETERAIERRESLAAEGRKVAPHKRPRRYPPAALTKYQLQYQKRKRDMMPIANYDSRNTKGEPHEWNGYNIHFVITALDPNTYQTVEHDGYLITREREDGSLYGINVHMGKPGGAESWVDQWAKQFTKNLRKMPLVDLLKEGMHQQFEPSGATNIPGIARCGSPIDLMCKIMAKYYAKELWAEMNQGKVQP